MNFFKFLLLIAIASICICQQSAFSHQDWIEHKNAYGKVYTRAEDAARKAIYKRNLIAINEHNMMADKGLVSYRKGVNKFTDMTHEEVVRQYMGLELPPEFKLDHPNVNETAYNSSSEEEQFELTAPQSRDWRIVPGRVGPVKDQGQCGSCWTFSAISPLESAIHAKSNQIVALSEQQLVDCSSRSPYGNLGCNGGWPESAYQYIIDNKGEMLSRDYPYTGRKMACRFTSSKGSFKMTSFKKSPSFGKLQGNEQWLEETVGNVGPVSVAIYVSNNFMGYHSGIFNDNLCSGHQVNHAVVVVGYGSENGRNYWIVRNSWSSHWGDNGYIRMIKNANNQCLISTYVVYPIV